MARLPPHAVGRLRGQRPSWARGPCMHLARVPRGIRPRRAGCGLCGCAGGRAGRACVAGPRPGQSPGARWATRRWPAECRAVPTTTCTRCGGAARFRRDASTSRGSMGRLATFAHYAFVPFRAPIVRSLQCRPGAPVRDASSVRPSTRGPFGTGPDRPRARRSVGDRHDPHGRSAATGSWRIRERGSPLRTGYGPAPATDPARVPLAE